MRYKSLRVFIVVVLIGIVKFHQIWAMRWVFFILILVQKFMLFQDFKVIKN